MNELIGNIRKQLTEFLGKLSTRMKIIIGAAILAVVAAAIVIAVLLNRVDYTVLYSELDASEAGTIVALLEEQAVDVKVQGTGTILVPAGQADELRMELASQGYPSSGFNYDIFQNASGFGATDLEKQTYKAYQLQEHLRTSIASLNKVSNCAVIVNLASKSSFVVSTNATDATVAVVLEVAEGEELTNKEVKAIGYLVLKSVPELTLENISIVDANMTYYDLLAIDEEEEEQLAEYTATQYELTEELKKTLTDQTLRVLKPVFGADNVAASVNLVMNFDRETVSSVEFEPPVYGEEDGIVRSSEELYEALWVDDEYTGGVVGTDANGVTAEEYIYDEGLEDGQVSESISRIYNYEINEIQTEIKKAEGVIEELSVSVVVNSNIGGAAGYTENVANLVANAIGVDDRYISVEALPFAESDSIDIDSYVQSNQDMIESMNRSDIIKTLIIVAAILLLALIVLRIFRKPDVIEVDEYYLDEDAALAAEGAEGSPEAMAAAGEGGEASPEQQEQDEFDELAALQGITIHKSDKIAQIEQFMDKYPELVAQVIKSWLNDEGF